MTEPHNGQFRTLADRIAELNRQKNFQAPPPDAGKRAAAPLAIERPGLPIRAPSAPQDRNPPLPTRPTASGRAVEEEVRPALPKRPTASSVAQEEEKGPPLPTRPGGRADQSADRVLSPPPAPSNALTQQASPSSAARRVSTQTLPPPPVNSSRRNSSTSIRSNASNASTASSQTPRKLPPAFGQTVLPPLPPTKRELEKRERQVAAMGTGDQIMSRLTQTKSTSDVPRLEDVRSAAGLAPRLRLGPPGNAGDGADAPPPPIPLGTRPA
jgi:hypothetical protein